MEALQLKMETDKFFEHIGHALSEASGHIYSAEKAKDIPKAQMWRKLHQELVKACAMMHEPQYERIKNK